MAKFTLNDLRNGDFVITRVGSKGVVIKNTSGDHVKKIVYAHGGFICLGCYDYNLIASTRPRGDHDIMRVYRGCACFDTFESEKVPIYDRDRDEAEEMTLDEICKALGKNVKIVKGE